MPLKPSHASSQGLPHNVLTDCGVDQRQSLSHAPDATQAVGLGELRSVMRKLKFTQCACRLVHWLPGRLEGILNVSFLDYIVRPMVATTSLALIFASSVVFKDYQWAEFGHPAKVGQQTAALQCMRGRLDWHSCCTKCCHAVLTS